MRKTDKSTRLCLVRIYHFWDNLETWKGSSIRVPIMYMYLQGQILYFGQKYVYFGSKFVKVTITTDKVLFSYQLYAADT